MHEEISKLLKTSRHFDEMFYKEVFSEVAEVKGVPIEIKGIEQVNELLEEMDKKIAEMNELADKIKAASSKITVTGKVG